MRPHPFIFLLALLCAGVNLSAQDKSPVKFGKVSAEDFTINQPYDSGANAVIIADIGNSAFAGNAKGHFSLIYKRFKRVKILNKNGFSAADITIMLYQSGEDMEKLQDLKAVTYNLENGAVLQTKLDGASIFKDKLDNKHTVKKFTFPAIKEGSIIEYSYSIESDFLFNLQPWNFQDEYPCLWSEYKVEIPEFFNYVTLNQGYIMLDKKSDSYPSSFRLSMPGGADKDEQVSLSGDVYTSRWVAKNISALKEENYTSAIKNYMSGLEFQLASYQFRGDVLHDMIGNWQTMSRRLMESDYFGADLARNNNWLDDDLKNVTKGVSGKLEKAKKVFAFVRDNQTCTSHSAIYLETSLKDAYKKHSGSVADINLLLTAMLRHEGFNADPLLLSTRDNGFTNEIYPLVDRFNYVVCHVEIDGINYNLDASSPYNGFNCLPPYCYNGHARVITKETALPVYFESDSLTERKVTAVFISNDEKDGMVGSFKSQLGAYESFNLRGKLKGDEREYLKGFKSGNSFEIKVSDAGIDSLKIPDMPAQVHYDFTFKPSSDENIIYMNPMMSEAFKENPFRSADRRYPVEMPYTIDETYLLNMEIPKGYVVEEIPKSSKVVFNGDEGSFEYLIQKSEDKVQLRTRIKLNKANFTPEDYNGLRDFFAFVVTKENEQIVLKKK